MVDSGDRARLEACRQELRTLLVEEKLAGASLLIFANKQDLPGALTKEQIQQVQLVWSPPEAKAAPRLGHTMHSHTAIALRAVGAAQALDLDSIVSHHWEIQDCSAVTGLHLLEGMNWIVDDIASRIYLMD